MISDDLVLIRRMGIAGSVPLGQAVAPLISLAPKGIIKFVRKTDRTVQQMVRFREDIFDGYREGAVHHHLEASTVILRREEISTSGRPLYIYQSR